MRWRRKPGFGDLYRKHAREVYDWFRARTPNHETAAELTAETFARGLERYGRVRSPGGEATAIAWIFGIAKNVLREHRRQDVRSDSARRRLGLASPQPWPGDEIESRLTAQREGPLLERALNGLPEEQQATLRMRIVDELGYAEIARRLACSEPAARQRVARALAALKLELKAWTP